MFCRIIRPVLLGLVIGFCDVIGAPSKVAVTAPEAPIFDAPSASAEVVGRVSHGTALIATGKRNGDWFEVQAPSSVSGWVYGELVRDGVIAASSVRVRSGPGIGYLGLGTLTKGAPVELRGTRGDWTEIGGQPSFLVWVESSMVAERAAVNLTVQEVSVSPPVVLPPEELVGRAEVSSVFPVQTAPEAEKEKKVTVVLPQETVTPQKFSPKVERVPIPAPVSVVTVPAGEVHVPFQRAPTKGRKQQAASASVSRRVPRVRASVGETPTVPQRLVASAPQGESVSVSGVLRSSGASLIKSSDYRLVLADGQGPARTICYIIGSEEIFLHRMGSSVVVEGRKYWVLGAREPVILVSSVR